MSIIHAICNGQLVMAIPAFGRLWEPILKNLGQNLLQSIRLRLQTLMELPGLLKEGTTLISSSGYILSTLHTSKVASGYCFDHYFVAKVTELGLNSSGQYYGFLLKDC